MLVLFILLLPINGTCQSSFEELTDDSESTILLSKVAVDKKYIKWVNDSKKMSSEEKANKISEHKEQVNEHNNNLEEAIEGLNGNDTFIFVDTSNVEYLNTVNLIAEAKENDEKEGKIYYVTYFSEPLSGESKKFKDPIFGGTHRPSLMLVETDLAGGSAKVVTKILVSQGVLSSGLLLTYINAVIAQQNDIDDGVTWKSKEVYLERMTELRSKTLLIPEDFLNKKLTTESIKEEYPFDFKVVNKEELNLLIQNDESEEGYVIYQIIPQTVTTRSGSLVPGVGISQSAIMYKSALFDVKSGRRMDLQEIKLSLAGSSGTDDLTKKELKKFVKQIN